MRIKFLSSILAVAIAQMIANTVSLAAIINLGVNCTLVDAVLAAETNAQVQNSLCTPGDDAGGEDVIRFQVNSTVVLGPHTTLPGLGDTATPHIESNIRIEGQNSILTAPLVTQSFRAFAVLSSGNLIISDLIIQRLSTTHSGGAIYVNSNASLTLNNVTIRDSSNPLGPVSINGGAIFSDGGLVELIDSTIDGHRAEFGAAIFTKGSLVVRDSTISDNEADGVGSDGGGIFFENPENRANTLLIENSTLMRNRARNGAGLYIKGAATGVNIIGSEFNSNVASRGGGIYAVDSSFTLSETDIRSNRAQFGGGINIESATSQVSLNSSLFQTNWTGDSGGFGGAIRIIGDPLEGYGADIVASTFNSNEAGDGAGIYVQRASVGVSNSTFFENTASEFGGGINCASFIGQLKNTLDIDNSLFYRNRSNGANGGGAIAGNRACDVTIGNSIVSGNFATNGGGSAFAGVSPTNKLLVTSLGFNMLAEPPIPEGDPLHYHDVTFEEPPAAASDIFPQVLRIERFLEDHGGPTPTVALLEDSPGRDIGGNCPTTDQRGLPKTGPCDAGPFEVQSGRQEEACFVIPKVNGSSVIFCL